MRTYRDLNQDLSSKFCLFLQASKLIILCTFPGQINLCGLKIHFKLHHVIVMDINDTLVIPFSVKRHGTLNYLIPKKNQINVGNQNQTKFYNFFGFYVMCKIH